MPEIDMRSTQESNFQIEKTGNNTYVVRSDSERFGKQEITYESPNREDCLEYIAQRRPERQFRFYIIPDLMSWSMPAYFEKQTPIEKYDSLPEAVARFQELYPQSYNAEVTDRNSVGLTYARLTLGMEWSEKGKLPGAIDLIHVRKGQGDHATHDVELSPLPVYFEDFPGEAMGYMDRTEQKIVVREGLSELQSIKTLVHEIAHAQRHNVDPDSPDYVPLDRATKECEAESIAYIVCQHFGLDTSE